MPDTQTPDKDPYFKAALNKQRLRDTIRHLENLLEQAPSDSESYVFSENIISLAESILAEYDNGNTTPAVSKEELKGLTPQKKPKEKRTADNSELLAAATNAYIFLKSFQTEEINPKFVIKATHPDPKASPFKKTVNPIYGEIDFGPFLDLRSEPSEPESESESELESEAVTQEIRRNILDQGDIGIVEMNTMKLYYTLQDFLRRAENIQTTTSTPTLLRIANILKQFTLNVSDSEENTKRLHELSFLAATTAPQGVAATPTEKLAQDLSSLFPPRQQKPGG